MSSKKASSKRKQSTDVEKIRRMLANQQRGFTENITTLRASLLSTLDGTGRDINAECLYPNVIDIKNYKEMYDREGIAARVVNLFPDESWIKDPIIKETSEKEATAFEVAWEEFQQDHMIYHYIHRIDRLSGIGRFGILFFGVNDGGAPDVPLIDAPGDESRELLFLRPFDESVVEIKTTVKDPRDPRFGKPEMYQVQLEGTDGSEGAGNSMMIHYTRVIHVADLRQMSEIYGTPRMKSTYNRLIDLRKVLSGSGEMFWKGAFPGYSFEVNPDATTGDIDGTEFRDSIKEQMLAYSNGLQRYLAVTGVKVTSLLPQMANPEKHFAVELRAIAVSLGIPNRIFTGSEEAKLASTADRETWMQRLLSRQDKYLTPLLVRPFIDRMIAIGVISAPKTDYAVEWPPLTMPNEKDKAEVANLLSEAVQKYVESGAVALIAEMDFLTEFLGIDKDKAEAMIASAEGLKSLVVKDDGNTSIVGNKSVVSQK